MRHLLTIFIAARIPYMRYLVCHVHAHLQLKRSLFRFRSPRFPVNNFPFV